MSRLIRKEIIGNELYLWIGDKLIYKRWLETGQSMTFDVMAYDKHTYMSIRDKGTFDSNDWSHLHDVVLESTGKSLERDSLYEFFEGLPEEIQKEAVEYGMNDTCWRDSIYEHLKNK